MSLNVGKYEIKKKNVYVVEDKYGNKTHLDSLNEATKLAASYDFQDKFEYIGVEELANQLVHSQSSLFEQICKLRKYYGFSDDMNCIDDRDERLKQSKEIILDAVEQINDLKELIDQILDER